MANLSAENSCHQIGGRAILWIIPRSISTAFTKCMSGIPDCEVWLEPFGFCSTAVRELKKAGIKNAPISYHGHEEVFQLAAEALENIYHCKFLPDRLQYDTIWKEMEASTSKYVFSKDESASMTTRERRQYIPMYKHAFLIRHPILVFKSLRKGFYRQYAEVGLLKHNEDETSFDYREYAKEDWNDVIFKRHHELWTYIRENIDPSPLVLDSSELLKNPAAVLSKFCEATGLPYSDSLLKWDASPEVCKSWKWPCDDLWKNEAFFDVSMYSTHFTPPQIVPSEDELTEDVRELAGKAMPYYEDMLKYS